MIFAGQVMDGACVSLTVTVKVHEAVLPEASVAVTVTVVVPTGNTEPEAGNATTDTPGQLSKAVGRVYETVALHDPGVLFTVILAGQVILGAWVSATVIVKVQLSDPQLFVAVAVTVVVPTGKIEPEGIE